MRAFVALPLPEEAVDLLDRVQERLGTGRLVPAEHMHVTLAFLDDQPLERLEALHEGLAEIVSPLICVQFSGVEAKGGRRPGLVWATLVEDAALTALRERVRGAARAAGMDLRRERFRPHVTLARFGRTRPVDHGRLGAWLAQHGTFRAGPFALDRMCLYRSTLTPEGPVYDVMAEYSLG